MSRLPEASREDIPENLMYVWEAITEEWGVPNIFRALGNNPDILRGYLRLGNTLWNRGGLDPQTRELVILRTAVLCHSQYEWHQHVRIGRSVGLSDARITGVHHWRTSDVYSEAERAALAYTDALASSDHPPREVHDEAARHFPPAAMVALNLLGGFYAMTAKFLAAMEVEIEEEFVGWEP
jgi:alkylhydroperoxidase family enzyme